MKAKFALYDFAGKPTTHFLVEAVDLGTNAVQTKQKSPSHHVVLLDVSGSMYGALEEVKTHLEKVLTIEEFADPGLKITLITYSSHGDCRTHFLRAGVADVMASGSSQLQEIRNLRTRGLTGISQALTAAEALIDDKEITAITLMSDGCANDPSPYTEGRNIDNVVTKLQGHPNVFVVSIAYGAWADFGLLDAVSSRLSGKTVKASSAKDIYTAIHDTTALLSGGTIPTLEFGIGDFDFIVFVSHAAEKVLGGHESLQVRGLRDTDDKYIFRYREVGVSDYAASKDPICGDGTMGLDPVLAYCRVQIARGALNKAKFALIATRAESLIKPHYKAMTPSAVAEMAVDVERHLFRPTTCIFTKAYGLGETGPSVMHVLSILESHKDGFRIDLRKLTDGYKRIGVKRVPGTREADGSITPPAAKLQTVRDDLVAVSAMEFNRTTATVNLRTVQDAILMDRRPGKEGTQIIEVEGIPLALKDYRSFAVVADGSIHVDTLPVRIHDKRLHDALTVSGALVGGAFDPNVDVGISLSELPLVDFGEAFTIPGDLPKRLARLTVLSKILSGHLKDEAPAYTDGQVAALKELHVTSAMYFSPPTTNPYVDLTDAIGKGEIDTRLTFKVEVGTVDLLNLGKLQSGNAYLQRRFDFTTADGEKAAKPTLDMFGTGGAWSIKSLSARTVLTDVDTLCFPIYEDFLGLGSPFTIRDLLVDIDFDVAALHDVAVALRDHDADELIKLRRTVDRHIDGLFKEYLCPLVFYIGSSGLLPDNIDVPAMTADELMAKHPAVKLSKSEQEGLFYELPSGVVISVYTAGEYFSTSHGVDAAKVLQAA